MNPRLKTQLTAEDEWLIREWLTFVVDQYPVKRLASGEKVTDEDGEPVYDKVRKGVACFVNFGRTRMADSHDRVYVGDFEVVFRRDEPIGLDDLLVNARNPALEVVFTEAKIARVDPVVETRRGVLVQAAQCLRG